MIEYLINDEANNGDSCTLPYHDTPDMIVAGVRDSHSFALEIRLPSLASYNEGIWLSFNPQSIWNQKYMTERDDESTYLLSAYWAPGTKRPTCLKQDIQAQQWHKEYNRTTDSCSNMNLGSYDSKIYWRMGHYMPSNAHVIHSMQWRFADIKVPSKSRLLSQSHVK